MRSITARPYQFMINAHLMLINSNDSLWAEWIVLSDGTGDTIARSVGKSRAIKLAEEKGYKVVNSGVKIPDERRGFRA